MAVENAPEEGSGGEESAQPKKSGTKVVMLGIIAALLLSLVGAGGYFAFSMMAEKKKESHEAAAPAAKGEGGAAKGEAGGAPEDNKMGVFVSLDPFVVNLISDGGKRYLKVTIQIELAKPETTGEVTNKMPQIKDAIITVLSSKTADELLTIEGKFKLKEQILTRVNNLISTGVVRNVYFVEFVIQ